MVDLQENLGFDLVLAICKFFRLVGDNGTITGAFGSICDYYGTWGQT
jgi:hypothetical protein